MRTLWSSSASFLLCSSRIVWDDAVLGMKTHGDFEGGSIGMALQSAPLCGQSFKRERKKKRNLEFW